jgi:DNA polymerase-3 subunit beta
MIKQTIYTVSTDKTRLLFTGVLFEADDNKIRLVATDTHRLALRETAIETGKFESVVVPGNALIELNRIMRNDEEPVQVKIGKTYIVFEMEDSLVISRLLAGRFPSYRQIIPEHFTSSLRANTNDLSEALARAALLLDNEYPILYFTLNEKESIIALNTDSGWIKEKLKANYQGDSMEIYFNARYLIESLRVLPTEEVDISFTGPLSAAIIRPHDRDDYLSLLLPARPKND